MAIGKVTFNHTCKNESERFVLVGNAAEVISEHKTMDGAISALNKIRIGESKWAVARVLEPGESWSTTLEKSVYYDDPADESAFEIDPFFKSFEENN